MNRFRFSFCFLIVVFLCSTPLSAAQKTPQSLRELILFGLETNLGLQTIHLNRPISQASVIVEDAVFDVEIFASADYTDVSTPISSALSLTETSDSQQGSGTLGLHKKLKTGLSAAFSLNTEWIDDNNLTDDLSPRYRTGLLVDLVQPLMRGSGTIVNTTSLQLSQKKHRQTSLESQFEAQILALQIESLVSRVVGAAAIVQLRNEAHQLADELFVANQRRFEVGVIPVSEVLEAEAALADRQLNLSLAVQSRDLQFEELNRLFAQELPADFHCSSFYDFKSQLKKQKLPDEEELFASALQKRLDLKISEIDIESAYLQRDFHRNQLKPQLDLKIQVGINGLSGEVRDAAGNDHFSGQWSDSFVRAAQADGYQWGLGVEFSLPLGNRSARARYHQAELKRRQAGHRKRDQESALKTELRQQRVNLQHAQEQVKIAEHFEELAQTSHNQEQRRLDEGLSDTFRILFFQDKMIHAKIGRINALTQYYQTNAQLGFARGTILEQHQINLGRDVKEFFSENL